MKANEEKVEQVCFFTKCRWMRIEQAPKQESGIIHCKCTKIKGDPKYATYMDIKQADGKLSIIFICVHNKLCSAYGDAL